jgi:hypothetical protein
MPLFVAALAAARARRGNGLDPARSPRAFGTVVKVRFALDQSEIQTDMATPIPEAPSLQQLAAGALALALLARGKARWRRASAREAAGTPPQIFRSRPCQ